MPISTLSLGATANSESFQPDGHDVAALHDRQRLADRDDSPAQLLQRLERTAAGSIGRRVSACTSRAARLMSLMCDAAASWWPRQMKIAGPLAVERRSSSWSTSDSSVLEARLAAIEAAGVVHRRVAALDDRCETGTQHVCESLGLLDAAAPDRIQDRVRVGDLLQHVGDVLRGADRFAARIDPDIPPGLDDRHALAEDLRHLQQEAQVVRALDDLLERRRDAPVEESFLREQVAPWEGRRGIAVAQEVAEQGMHGLWTRRVQPEDAGSYSPAEVLECEAFFGVRALLILLEQARRVPTSAWGHKRASPRFCGGTGSVAGVAAPHGSGLRRRLPDSGAGFSVGPTDRRPQCKRLPVDLQRTGSRANPRRRRRATKC